MLEIGNKYYFLFFIVAVIIFITAYFLLRRQEKKTQRKVLTIVLFCNLALHFGKLLFEPYRSSLPGTIRKITFENICAVSTLIFPFIYLEKKEDSFLKSYMFFIGFMGGAGALLYPTEAIGKNPFTFDCIRFYICHSILIFVPLLSVIFKITKVNYRRLWQIPLMFLFLEIVILINELILMKIGFVTSTISEFFDRNIRNSSFIFGPTSAFDKIASIVLVFVPKIFTIDYFGWNGGIALYWPVIWMIIPVFIYIPVLYLIISLPFTYKDIISDWRKRK